MVKNKLRWKWNGWKHAHWYAAVLAILILTGCGTSGTQIPTITPYVPQTGPSPELTATMRPTITPFPTLASDLPTPLPVPLFVTPSGGSTLADAQAATPQATSPVQVTLPPAPTRTLQETGRLTGGLPWGLIPSLDGLWAVRADGGQVVLLTNDPIFHLELAPSGRTAAYLTHPDPYNQPASNPFGYTLNLIDLYTGQVQVLSALVGPDPATPNPDLTPENVFRLITAYQNNAMAWSPGGTFLAFVSGQESNSGEVYIFNIRTGAINRMTNPPDETPSFAFDLRFSPSGQKVYFSRAYDFGAGSGKWMAGAWVVTTQGQLTQVAGSDISNSNLLAWVNDVQVLLTSDREDCGEQDLRMTDVRNGEARSLWAGCLSNRFYDRRIGEVILTVSPEIAAFQPDTPAGMYRVRTWDGNIRTVTERTFERVFRGSGTQTWYGFQTLEGLSTIKLNGEVTPVYQGPPYDGTGPDVIRPIQQIPGRVEWLWSGSGLYVAAPGEEPQLVFPLQPENVTFSPVNNGLIFFLAYEGEAGRLFIMRVGEWQPYLVDERITTPLGISWTGP